jgi:hypothetical protein
MRLPFDFNDSKLDDEARIKFSYTSPELHQNIEISLDGDKTSVEALLDAFHRFLGALGVSTPEDVVLGFIKLDDEEGDGEDGEDEEDDEGPVTFTLDEDEDEDEDESDNKK